MDRFDVLLIAGAGYIAVISLVRLMAARRDDVIRQIRSKVEERRAALAAQEDDDDRDAA